jgi:alpha-galactosidase
MWQQCSWRLWFASLLIKAAADRGSPAHVVYYQDTRVFRIDTAMTTYVMGVNEQEQMQTLYWGARLPDSDHFGAAKAAPGMSAFDPPIATTPEEFVGWGGGLPLERSLKITFPDGTREVMLKYLSHVIHDNQLVIEMKDVAREVYVRLEYEGDAATGILRRSAEIENHTGAPLIIEQISTATWNLPPGKDYRLRCLTGRWAGEWNVQEQPVNPGKTVLESRRGTTGAQNNPWFAIDHQGDSDSDPEHGRVWFGALARSGSWQITVEQNAVRQVRVNGGRNSFDFGYRLLSGERFQTPYFYGGYSGEGIGGASRLLHEFEIDSLLPHAPTPKVASCSLQLLGGHGVSC